MEIKSGLYTWAGYNSSHYAKKGLNAQIRHSFRIYAQKTNVIVEKKDNEYRMN